MTGIGPADHVLLLLTEQLQTADRAKARNATQAARTAKTGPRDRLRALAAIGDLPPRALRHMLVRSLLAERLGEELVADPAFEAASLEIATIIEDTPEGAALLDRAIASLLNTP